MTKHLLSCTCAACVAFTAYTKELATKPEETKPDDFVMVCLPNNIITNGIGYNITYPYIFKKPNPQHLFYASAQLACNT